MSDWPDPPDALAERDIWLIWKLGYHEGMDPTEDDPTKIPLDPNTGRNGSATDPDIRTSFEDAVAALNRYDEADGIGFAFPENDLLVGTDLDDVRDPETGKLNRLGRDVMTTLDSYTEVSPSGTGLHIVTLALKPDDRCKRKLAPDGTRDGDECEIEMYDSDRFFTYTGERVDGVGFDEVEQRKNEVAEVYEEYLAENAGSGAGEWDGDAPDLDLDDEQVLEKARSAKNGDKFERLEKGDDSMHGGDTSRADQAFVNYLAFYTGGDRDQIDRLFRASGRMRDKWDPDNHSAYRKHTMDTALSGRTEFYEAGRGGQSPDVTAAGEAREDTEAAGDGGTATTPPSTAGPGPDFEPDPWNELKGRVNTEVIERLDPEDDDAESIDMKVAVDRAARITDDTMHFVRPRSDVFGWRDTLYAYSDGDLVGRPEDAGMYEPGAKAELERMGERLFGPIANDAFVREWTNKIERRNRVRAKRLEPEAERLVVGNGVLNLTTGKLDPHTPGEYHRVRVSHDWDPDAECPRIDEFFHEIVADDDVDTLYRFIAHALYRGYPESKAAMLLGDGANGKSMFLALVEEFLGKFNVSGRSLQDITEYRWAANDLVGKLANVHADMSDQDVDSMRMFKNLTGEDTVDADVKFENPVKFQNHATMLFACNDMPVMDDDTQGNWRRWVLINFPNTFDDADPAAKDATPRRVLERELFAESELEGLLARCVEEIKAWHEGRAWFPDVPGWRATRSKMRRAAEPVFDFAEACLRSDDDGQIEKRDIREAYREYATHEGLPKLTREEFGRKIIALEDYNIDTAEPRNPDGPGRLKVYTGVEFTPEGEELIGESDSLAPREAVREELRAEDGGMPEALVVERLEKRHGIDNGRAEHAVTKLKQNGSLIASERHNTDWVELT